MKRPLALLLALLLAGCTAGDAIRTARIIATGDVAGAQTMAAEKAARYALNPEAIKWDLKKFKERLEAFRDAIGGVWGEEEKREPTPKQYVKYTKNYLSRATVDFGKGLVTVETVDKKNTLESLRNAIVTTLLAPGDPRALDLYSAKEVKLGETPFLLGEVKDYDGKDIRWEWRANRYAQKLMERSLKTRTVDGPDGKPLTAHYVTFNLVRDHLKIRAAKYAPLVRKNAKAFGVSENLVYAIIKTESDFNPFATSHAPAFGLMQIVPRSAGAEVMRVIDKTKGKPSREFLYKPKNNIRYGTAYLHLLDTRHLKSISDPLTREYCVIAAYNTGAGNVLKTFAKGRSTAAARINSMQPGDVYTHMRKNLPYKETRRYLWKVLEAKKQFVGTEKS